VVRRNSEVTKSTNQNQNEENKNMSHRIKPIPAGFHTLTPHLVVKGAGKAIDFYKKAFGAQEVGRLLAPDGKFVMHADLKIGDSHVFLVDECPEMGSRAPESIGGTPVTIHMYVEDVDATFKKAVAAGAEVRMPVADMFWGDRYGILADPFGHSWSIATHKADLTPEQIRKGAETACSEAACRDPK
jgi:PhnB protein